jgi:hypothetical protein
MVARSGPEKGTSVLLNNRHDILEAAFPGQSSRFFLAMSIGGTRNRQMTALR